MSASEPGFERRRERYGVLLGAVIVAFAVEGVATPSGWEQVLTTGLLGATLLLSLFAAEARSVVIWIASALVVGCMILSVLEAISGNLNGGAVRLANAWLVLFAPPAIITGVVRSLRARQAVTLEAVFGVLCVYMLLGMLYAFIYGSIDRLGGAPFFANGDAATTARCMYFSFTTLTTVGYGDFTARTNLGHTLSVSESLLGQIYLVTVVSLIVANLGRGRSSPASTQPPSPTGS